MLLLCYAVGQTTKNKKAGTSRVVFLIELLGLFKKKKNPAKRERRRERWQRALKIPHPNTENAWFFFRLSGNIAGASLSLVTYCCKHANAPGRLFLKSIQNMQSRNSGGDKASQFPENDLTLFGICSNDFLNVFTRRLGEIWHLPPAAAPQNKTCRKLWCTNFALHQ